MLRGAVGARRVVCTGGHWIETSRSKDLLSYFFFFFSQPLLPFSLLLFLIWHDTTPSQPRHCSHRHETGSPIYRSR